MRMFLLISANIFLGVNIYRVSIGQTLSDTIVLAMFASILAYLDYSFGDEK